MPSEVQQSGAQPTEGSVDVVIIGGGLSGLAAADTLGSNNEVVAGIPGASPLTYVVLEATGRLGGRCYTDPPSRSGHATHLDLGGGFIGGSQNYLQFALRRFGIATIPTYLPKDKSWLYEDRDGLVHAITGNDSFCFPGEEGPAPNSNAPSMGVDQHLTSQLLGQLDALALQLRAHAAAYSAWPFAELMNAASVTQWLDGLIPSVSDRVRDLVRVSVRSAYSEEPEKLSMLFLLHYAARAGSYAALVDVIGGLGAAEATRFLYGTQELVVRFRAEIDRQYRNVFQNAGSPIRTNAAVSEVRAEGGGAIVVSTAGIFKAKHVIYAAPPSSMLPRPGLPGGITWTGFSGQKWDDRVALAKAMTMGQTFKGFVTFKRPFWRDNGLMGFTLSSRPSPGDNFAHPLTWILDHSWTPPTLPAITSGWPFPVGWNAPKPPKHPYVLMTFIVGDAARRWKDDDAGRAAAVLAHLEAIFGPQVGDLLEPTAPYFDYAWEKDIAGGAPTGLLGKVSTLEGLPALRAPVGPLHWAGTESAEEWCGYIDGALEAGVRAAGEVYPPIDPTNLSPISLNTQRLKLSPVGGASRR